MTADFDIMMCRGSIFIPGHAFNQDNIRQIQSGLFPDYMPVEKSGPSIDMRGQTIQISNPNWILESKGNDTEIVFLNGKIDVLLKNRVCKYSMDNLSKMSDKIQAIAGDIINKFGMMSTRIAFAPTLVNHNIDQAYITAFAHNIFKGHKFMNEDIDSCEFSNVFRIMSDIGGENVKVNYLASFSVVQIPFFHNNSIVLKDSLQMSIDINTFPSPEYRFPLESVRDFFTKSPGMVNDFVLSYFDIKEA